jgi:hypothetical protein
MDFMLSLIADAASRLGKHGVGEIQAHPWFTGCSWDSLAMRTAVAPYRPERADQIAGLLEQVRLLDKEDPRLASAVAALTANFEKFEESGLWEQPNRVAHRRDKDQNFIGYTYKRKPRGRPQADFTGGTGGSAAAAGAAACASGF